MRKYHLLCRCLSASKLDSSYNEDRKISKEFQELTLDELEVVATLGMGGFGRVELVREDILIFFRRVGKREDPWAWLSNNPPN